MMNVPPLSTTTSCNSDGFWLDRLLLPADKAVLLAKCNDLS